MKTMTCKELGGACDLEFHANTFEEIAKMSKKHGMEMFHIGQDVALVLQRPEEVGTKPPIGEFRGKPFNEKIEISGGDEGFYTLFFDVFVGSTRWNRYFFRACHAIAETQSQLQPALLRLSAMISQYFTRFHAWWPKFNDFAVASAFSSTRRPLELAPHEL
jgi:hypothetical protein